MFLAAAMKQIGNRFHKIMKCFQQADKGINQPDFFFVKFVTPSNQVSAPADRVNISNIERLR